ncbi:uncharacterized protein LOC128957979 [Oppia nitens]|uniref:uncharacterized protein LOC128957979 n=1 Tax=Oppia nitens TaxID=1686743 RepID=UPI0023DC047F|nr:uncharacterized protein LOC128957979 [Oppia nitens]
MTLGLFGPGPLQMLFSVLMMQGLSLTMFRTFLNQAIPRFDPMRFSFKLGNDPQLSSTTPTSAPNIDQQNLMPIINMLAPILLQQHLQRSQNNQMQINDKSSLTQTQVMSPIGSYQMPVQSVPIQSSMTNMPPMPQQVIIIPQMQSPSRGSASTHIPVLMNAPNNNVNKDKDHPVRITKRILERPPKTTRKPNRVINRAHAGAIHLSFITPKPPISARKYVIPVVTANSLVGDSDIESIKTFNKSNSLELNNASINENLVDNDNDTKISINFQQTTTSRPTISTSDPITSTVTDTTTTTTTTQAITLSQTTTLTETFDKNDIEII